MTRAGASGGGFFHGVGEVDQVLGLGEHELDLCGQVAVERAVLGDEDKDVAFDPLGNPVEPPGDAAQPGGPGARSQG
ncbi:hypothetical protein ACQPYK_23925 [Streptosporangium sp. CA-135522]|uniref:hypothetical protein n=1 Tax=Streptosporangium sp. CA-135522 TaxID=3240072 RepID=UPI003D8DE05A